MSKRYDSSKQWYAIHTYSGYEEKVADSIKQRAESLDMADKIFDVIVPKEKQIEIKNGKRKVVEKKIFQGYVLVQMKMGEDVWYIVRNTPNVTGFVGSGTEPSPVSDDEISKILKRMGAEDPKHKIDFKIGEVVSIIDGPFKSFDGAINEIDAAKGKLKVLVSMFGRETPVELDALQVKKVLSLAGFEKQGLGAASCEPFSEFARPKTADLKISSSSYETQRLSLLNWNNAVLSMHKGDLDAADEFLAALDDLPRQSS